MHKIPLYEDARRKTVQLWKAKHSLSLAAQARFPKSDLVSKAIDMLEVHCSFLCLKGRNSGVSNRKGRGSLLERSKWVSGWVESWFLESCVSNKESGESVGNTKLVVLDSMVSTKKQD